MANKRRTKKRKSKFFKIIEDHINQNIKEYAISVIIFLIGIIIGVMLLNSSSQENQQTISGYINEFTSSIKNQEYTIDQKKLFAKSVVSNLKIAVMIWIAGSTIIGIPLVYGSLAYKAMCIGYSISAIIATMEKSKGIIFSLSSMLLQNIIAIPCILALAVSSIKMHRSIMKQHNKENIKSEIYRHTMFSIIMMIGLFISSLIEIFVSTNITSNIIVNFI
ncbi:MAG: stage II sporulation protein M [Clostridia bacterium]|nr:stage II sporulation protein M [Clostridia bacterium]